MVDKKTIETATEMTKGIPWKDVLVPLMQEEKELTPYPQVEYKVIEGNTMDKLTRDVNSHLQNGRQTEWWVQVVSGVSTRFYQSMIRWNIDANIDAKPEMPSKNSEAGTMGPKPLDIPGLEDEEDLYEDIEKDAEQ